MKDGEIPHNPMKFIGQGRNVTDNGKFVIFFPLLLKWDQNLLSHSWVRKLNLVEFDSLTSTYEL